MRGSALKLDAFSVTSEQRGHTAYLHVAGELDMATSPVLEGRLHVAESNGNTAIVVDLQHLTFIDASGLRAFLGAAQRANGSGRTFTITRASTVVRRLLQITGTTHLLAADELALARDRHVMKPPPAAQSTTAGGPDVVAGISTAMKVAQTAR